jgi:hypothetical protein
VTSRRKPSPASSSKALAKNTIFGPPPILEGEVARAYNKLLARVSTEVMPQDILEEIWVRDVVDLTWEIFRWRKLVVSFLPFQHLHEIEKGRACRSASNGS